jgi:hypothetical protein
VAKNENLNPTDELVVDLPAEGFEIRRVNPILLVERDKNARVQSPAKFKALVRNAKNRKALESLPLCYRREDGKLGIISGHHRARAAIQAELPTILVLVEKATLTTSQVIAKQIAHNSINGQDDPSVLLQLMDEITEVDALLETAVDRAELARETSEVAATPDVQVNFDWRTVVFAFLPTQLEKFEELIDRLPKDAAVYSVPMELHDKFLAAMRKMGRAEQIRNVGAIVAKMVEVTEAALAAKEAEAQGADQPPAPAADEEKSGKPSRSKK